MNRGNILDLAYWGGDGGAFRAALGRRAEEAGGFRDLTCRMRVTSILNGKTHPNNCAAPVDEENVPAGQGTFLTLEGQ